MIIQREIKTAIRTKRTQKALKLLGFLGFESLTKDGCYVIMISNNSLQTNKFQGFLKET